MQTVAASQPWKKDPMVIRKPWSIEEYNLRDHGGNYSSLVFAMKWDNGDVVPHPPIIRAMEITKAALIAAGHKGMCSVGLCRVPP